MAEITVIYICHMSGFTRKNKTCKFMMNIFIGTNFTRILFVKHKENVGLGRP